MPETNPMNIAHRMTDIDLLHAAARLLGIEAEQLMLRYYGSRRDARAEMEELNRTGRLQASFAAMLRLELSRQQPAAA
jgi:hypothetical protein